MKKKYLIALACVMLVAGGAGTAGSAAWASPPGRGPIHSPGIWYEDNNMAVAGGTPADFYTKFMNPESWENARRAIDVYYVRSSVLEGASDDFLHSYFLPVLAKSHIKLAVDTGAATYTHPQEVADSAIISATASDIALFDRIRRLGGKVDYVGLQSTLSKPLALAGGVDFPMADRIKNVVYYAAAVKKAFPAIKIGLIDALPTKGLDYQGPYSDLVQALNAKHLSLHFIDLDSQYELAQAGITTSWAKITQVQAYVQEQLHLNFGLVATSRAAGYTSDEAFYNAVTDVPVEYQKVGGYPDEYVIMSWYPHPAVTVPDSAGPGQYPAMKTVLGLAHQIGR